MQGRKVPQREQAVFAELLTFKKRLNSELKHNNATLSDVNALSNQLDALVNKLKSIRSEVENERNKVDDLLDAIFLLMFKLWAKNAQVDSSIYPVYNQLANISKAVDELRASGSFTLEEITQLQETTNALEQKHFKDGRFIDPRHADKIPAGQAILSNTLNKIHRSTTYMLGKVDSISKELEPVFLQLKDIKTKLDSLKKIAPDYKLADVQQLQGALINIDSFIRSSQAGVSIPSGHAAVSGLLAICFDACHELVELKDEISGDLRPIYESLERIKHDLQANISSTARFSIDESDLRQIQYQLDAIDGARVNGKFVVGTKAIPKGQAVLHYLLNQCYSMLAALLADNVPVSDALFTTYEILLLVKEKLRDIKRTLPVMLTEQQKSVLSKELNKISETLSVVEGMKINGIYWGNEIGKGDGNLIAEILSGKQDISQIPANPNDAPSGQAVISNLFNHCITLVQSLRMRV